MNEFDCFNCGGTEVCLLRGTTAHKTMWWFLTGRSI